MGQRAGGTSCYPQPSLRFGNTGGDMGRKDKKTFAGSKTCTLGGEGMKLFGALLVLFSSTAAGWLWGTMLRKRLKTLGDLRQVFQWLETEIGYNLFPLQEAFRRIGERLRGETSIITGVFVGFLNSVQGLTAEEAWRQTVQTCREKLVLAEYDCKVLDNIGCTLGTKDRHHQMKAIHARLERIQIQEEEARTNIAKHEKLHRYLRTARGTLVILLFY